MRATMRRWRCISEASNDSGGRPAATGGGGTAAGGQRRTTAGGRAAGRRAWARARPADSSSGQQQRTGRHWRHDGDVDGRGHGDVDGRGGGHGRRQGRGRRGRGRRGGRPHTAGRGVGQQQMRRVVLQERKPGGGEAGAEEEGGGSRVGPPGQLQYVFQSWPGEGGEFEDPRGAAGQRHRQLPGRGEDLGVQAGRAASLGRSAVQGARRRAVHLAPHA
ncbi:hypothetical protein FM21_36480, partial [Streptomyces mutabilis]